MPFSARDAADRYADLIASYVEQLEACGIDVVETETPILKRPDGYVLYCVQPLLPSGSLGPDFLKGKTAERGRSLRAANLRAHPGFGDAVACPGRAVVELGV